MHLIIHTDGGSRGNPGPSGFGVVIASDSATILYQAGVFLGTKTNNEAEYAGLIHALTWLVDHQSAYTIDKITIYMDSELIVHHLDGQYKVKSANLKPLYLECLQLLGQIRIPLKIVHTLREGNSQADLLANTAMDRGYNI